MMVELNLRNLINVGLVIIIIMLLFDRCKTEEAFKALQVKFDNDISQIRDSLGNIIAVKDAQIVGNQESMKELRARLFQTTENYNQKVKEVQALIAQKTVVIFKEIYVPYVDTIKMKKWADSIAIKCKDVIQYYEESSVPVGKQAIDSTGHYKIDATVQKNGLKINEIKFIDSQYVSITKMKGGLFKKNTAGKLKFYQPPATVIEIKHTNPYFQNKGSSSFVYKKKNTRGYPSGLLHGALGGLLFGLLLTLSP